MNGAVITLTGVSKQYPAVPAAVQVLQDISLEVDAGETIAITGPSGCGKSTLLNLMGALDTPSAGRILFGERDITALPPNALAQLRNREIGFVFQLHHLLPQCTALENVLVPSLASKDAGDVRSRAMHLLERAGLADRVHYRPGQLSGGERQRVAVARALINRPRLLLADEPTGSLSQEGAEQLTGMLIELNREEGTALVVVTHSPAVAQRMGRILELRDGRLTERA